MPTSPDKKRVLPSHRHKKCVETRSVSGCAFYDTAILEAARLYVGGQSPHKPCSVACVLIQLLNQTGYEEKEEKAKKKNAR